MDKLREQLVKSLKGGQAFVGFRRALDGVKPENRATRANKATHSIYEELEHMRRAQADLYNYMLDSDWESPEWPAGFWPNPDKKPSEAEWRETVDGFFRDLNGVVKLVEDPSIDVLSVVPGATEYTYLREILIIIEHNAYHLGKILDTRKSLGDWK
jgi:hypothetical protein